MPHTIVDSASVEKQHGILKRMGPALGVSAFGINQLEIPPGAEAFGHDHEKDGQEEVYVVIRGGGTIRVDGTEETIAPGQYIFIPPGTHRQMVAGDEGLTWIGVGCQPGAYSPE